VKALQATIKSVESAAFDVQRCAKTHSTETRDGDDEKDDGDENDDDDG